MGQKEDGKDSVAQQVEPESHWPELRILVLVVGQLWSVGETEATCFPLWIISATQLIYFSFF